jgi:predicted Rdx family selenoprotein
MAGADVELIKGGRGDFIVIADGTEVWNKKKTGRFPDESAVIAALRRL